MQTFPEVLIGVTVAGAGVWLEPGEQNDSPGQSGFSPCALCMAFDYQGVKVEIQFLDSPDSCKEVNKYLKVYHRAVFHKALKG